MKKINFLHIIILLSIVGCVNDTNSSNKKSADLQSTKQSIESNNKNLQYLDYNIAIKCPVMLKSNPNKSPNITLHYTGLDDDSQRNKGAYYEVAILDLSYLHPSEVVEPKLHNEILSQLLEDSQEAIRTIAGMERIVHLRSYRESGNNGKSLAFVEDGIIYMLNVIGNDNIDKRFQDFTDSFSFKQKPAEKKVAEKPKENIKEVINENDFNTSNLIYHQDRSNKFSIKYPNNWDAIEDYNQVIALLSYNDFSSKGYNISVIKNTSRTLEKLVESNKKQMMNSFADAKVLDEYTLMVNGIKAIKVEVTATDIYGSKKLYYSIFSFLRNKDLYIVNFNCELDEMYDYKKEINKIISTFRIND